MANIPGCTFTAGDYVIGFDPGNGNDQASAVTMKRHPNGRIEVIGVETFTIAKDSRDRRAEIIPFHFARECSVCENDRVVILAGGPHLDLLDCPACIGLRKVDLTSWEQEDVEAMCESVGLKPRWRP